MCACVRVCVRACVRASVRACVRVCIYVRACLRACVRACVRTCVRACMRAFVCAEKILPIDNDVWRLIICPVFPKQVYPTFQSLSVRVSDPIFCLMHTLRSGYWLHAQTCGDITTTRHQTIRPYPVFMHYQSHIKVYKSANQRRVFGVDVYVAFSHSVLAGYPALLGPLPLYFSIPIRYSFLPSLPRITRLRPEYLQSNNHTG